jgi:hypothetical protein
MASNKTEKRPTTNVTPLQLATSLNSVSDKNTPDTDKLSSVVVGEQDDGDSIETEVPCSQNK